MKNWVSFLVFLLFLGSYAQIRLHSAGLPRQGDQRLHRSRQPKRGDWPRQGDGFVPDQDCRSGQSQGEIR